MYSSYRVRDVMRKPVTARPGESIETVVKRMYENDSSSAVIVDDSGKPLGIFTEKDLVRVVAKGIPLSTRIEEVMTPRPVTVRDDDYLAVALQRMIEYRIRNLPVVDKDGNLVGLITARDVTKVLKLYKEEVGELE